MLRSVSLSSPPLSPSSPGRPTHADKQRFKAAEDVWFWFMHARQASADGARIRAGLSSQPRAYEPLDILQIVDRLYRNRRLLRDHLLVLRHYGVRHMAPDADRLKEARAAFLWEQAMAVLEEAFIGKGILAGNNWLPCRNTIVPMAEVRA